VKRLVSPYSTDTNNDILIFGSGSGEEFSVVDERGQIGRKFVNVQGVFQLDKR
jgi:hypothetical protein